MLNNLVLNFRKLLVKLLSKIKTRLKYRLSLKKTRRRLLLGLLVMGLVGLGWSNHYFATKTSQINSEKLRVEQHATYLEQQRTLLDEKLKEYKQLKKQDTKKKKQLKEEIQRLKALSASRKSEKPASPTPTPKLAGTTGNCGDNKYKQFIYQKESGCNSGAENASGCFGIGQACPGSKIAHCGTDFACQDRWFSNYALTRYGGWEQAYNAWLAQGWW